jgi:hypothetical protein
MSIYAAASALAPRQCAGMLTTVPGAPPLQIEFQRPGEPRHVPIELALQGREGRRQLMHAARGVIRRESAGIVLRGPAPAGLVVVTELLTFTQESIVESLPVGAAESRRVDKRGKSVWVVIGRST